MNNVGEYGMPRMNDVHCTLALSTAIWWSWNDIDLNIVKCLSSKSSDENYLLPRAKVAEDMLTIVDYDPEMTERLKGPLEQ